MDHKNKFEFKEYNEKFYLVKWMVRQIFETIAFFVIFVLGVQALVSLKIPINIVVVLLIQLALWVTVKIMFKRYKSNKKNRI